jgi:predicted transcriptional regulator
MRTSCTFRLPFEVDERMRDLARRNKCDISIVARHAFYEYLQARGVDCFKPIGCF